MTKREPLTPEQLSNAWKGFVLVVVLFTLACICTCGPMIGLIAHATQER